MTVTFAELQWAAGFLEGEGSFSRHRAGLSAVQNQRWPLDRLCADFGGSIHGPYRATPNQKGHYRWDLTGSRAAGVMMTLYALMSPRRKEQIGSALRVWSASRFVHWSTAVTCINGHPWNAENTRRMNTKKQKRACRVCARAAQKRYHAKKKGAAA